MERTIPISFTYREDGKSFKGVNELVMSGPDHDGDFELAIQEGFIFADRESLERIISEAQNLLREIDEQNLIIELNRNLIVDSES